MKGKAEPCFVKALTCDNINESRGHAILFFASDDSAGCNGQVVVVDNGII